MEAATEAATRVTICRAALRWRTLGRWAAVGRLDDRATLRAMQRRRQLSELAQQEVQRRQVLLRLLQLLKLITALLLRHMVLQHRPPDLRFTCTDEGICIVRMRLLLICLATRRHLSSSNFPRSSTSFETTVEGSAARIQAGSRPIRRCHSKWVSKRRSLSLRQRRLPEAWHHLLPCLARLRKRKLAPSDRLRRRVRAKRHRSA